MNHMHEILSEAKDQCANECMKNYEIRCMGSGVYGVFITRTIIGGEEVNTTLPILMGTKHDCEVCMEVMKHERYAGVRNLFNECKKRLVDESVTQAE